MGGEAKKERACRRCGCTENQACDGGCFWVPGMKDVCSDCLTVDEVNRLMAKQLRAQVHRREQR